MSNLLQDLLPDAPRETSLLVAAAAARVPDLIRGQVSHGMDVRTAVRLAAASLADRTAFGHDACEWVAAELAISLGLARPDDFPPSRPVQRAEGSPQIFDVTRSAAAPAVAARMPGSPRVEQPTVPQSAGPLSVSRSRRSLPRGVFAVTGLAVLVIAVATTYGLSRLASPSPAVRNSGARPGTHEGQPATASAASSPVPVPDNVWIAQLASVPIAAGTAHLDAVLARVRRQIPAARVLDSADYASLNPGFWVVYYQGPFTNGGDALTYCAAHGRLTANQCIGRFLSHSPADFSYQCYPPADNPSGTCFHP
ncbi:MAG TPA: hypothetical protein VF162_21430 [Streptosporangiaceae bacterium]